MRRTAILIVAFVCIAGWQLLWHWLLAFHVSKEQGGLFLREVGDQSFVCLFGFRFGPGRVGGSFAEFTRLRRLTSDRLPGRFFLLVFCMSRTSVPVDLHTAFHPRDLTRHPQKEEGRPRGRPSFR